MPGFHEGAICGRAVLETRIHADRVEADDFVLEDVLGSNWIGAGGSLSDTFQEYAVKLWRRQ
jgi:hypothetical protein